ncbi:MAG: ThuA domain-containing protein, partial [Saccharofermentanales bacterium]
EEEGFEVQLSDTLDRFADKEALKAFSLIVPVWTMGEISHDYVQNVCEAVDSGTGLAGCHGGMCDSFRNDTGWQFLTGSQWVDHPGNDGVEYTVDIVKSASSPIIEGIGDFTVRSEQYYLHVDPAVNVLATTRFPVIDGPHAANGAVDMPVIYTKRWGKGRVFYSSLGHVANVFDVPEVKQLMRNGFLWAAR